MSETRDRMFDETRRRFVLPHGVIYLDGNSLGPPVAGVSARVLDEIDGQWASKLIRCWNESGWMDLPRVVGDKIARLIGAPAGSVVAGDSTSVNLFKVLSAALRMRPERHVVLSDSGNFPNDLYVAQGLLAMLGVQYELRIVEPEDVADAIDESLAALMLTQVDYRTGRVHDMAALTALAHRADVLTVWDLCHSAGAMPVHLEEAEADFAVGCGYKYLNGGPGAPAFAYVRPEHQALVRPALAGWLGHESPFAFDLDYRPGAGIDRMRVGTPPILAMASLDAALDVWDGVDLADVRAASIELSELFVAEVEARCPGLVLASPRDPEARGSQVSFRHPEGYAIVQALIARGVIGDFRAPDIARFGFTPLYLSAEDVVRAVDALESVMRERLWDRPEYRRRNPVT